MFGDFAPFRAVMILQAIQDVVFGWHVTSSTTVIFACLGHLTCLAMGNWFMTEKRFCQP
jgi:hypothetical protein